MSVSILSPRRDATAVSGQRDCSRGTAWPQSCPLHTAGGRVVDDRAGHRPFGRRSGACARSQSCNLGQRSRTISDNLASPRLPSPPLAPPRLLLLASICGRPSGTRLLSAPACLLFNSLSASAPPSSLPPGERVVHLQRQFLFSPPTSISFLSLQVSEWCICDDYGFESHCFVKARGSREAAERQRRCSRGAAEMQPRCSRGAAEVQRRCSRDAAEDSRNSPSSPGQGGRTPLASRPHLGHLSAPLAAAASEGGGGDLGRSRRRISADLAASEGGGGDFPRQPAVTEVRLWTGGR